MNTYFPAFRNRKVKKIHDVHHMVKSSCSHILPAFIKASNPMRIEILRNIAETNCWDNTVSTIRVFPRFLQIENSFDVQFFKTRVQPILFYQSLGWPLHCENIGGNPVGMKTLNGVGLDLIGSEILLIASVTSTKLAEKDSLLVKLINLEPQSETVYLGGFEICLFSPYSIFIYRAVECPQSKLWWYRSGDEQEASEESDSVSCR